MLEDDEDENIIEEQENEGGVGDLYADDMEDFEIALAANVGVVANVGDVNRHIIQNEFEDVDMSSQFQQMENEDHSINEMEIGAEEDD